jgi:hypothetical protein
LYNIPRKVCFSPSLFVRDFEINGLDRKVVRGVVIIQLAFDLASNEDDVLLAR